MENKRISPSALIALKDALSKIYWYKKDAKKFVEYTINNNAILLTIDWINNTKYESISQLIDRMNNRSDLYINDMLNLLYEVCNFDDFSHFDRLKKGDVKKCKDEAQQSVLALRKHCQGYFNNLAEKKLSEKAKEGFKLQQQNTADYIKRIEEFKCDYYKLSISTDHQKRGYQFEQFLNELFYFFDLSPRSSFKIYGEQIDGAFTHDNKDYLLEAKWYNKPIERKEIDIFEAKICRKLKTTLGLFVSVNGFVDVLNSSTIQCKSVILMDSTDLIQVLENRISLPEIILQKRRHASETGESMYRVNI